jgi:hypothetical protein
MAPKYSFLEERRASATERTRHRWARWGLATLPVLVVALVAFRIALPTIVRDYVNRTLSKIPGYRGQVTDVDIHLWRGAYTIRGANVVRTTFERGVIF